MGPLPGVFYGRFSSWYAQLGKSTIMEQAGSHLKIPIFKSGAATQWRFKNSTLLRVLAKRSYDSLPLFLGTSMSSAKLE